MVPRRSRDSIARCGLTMATWLISLAAGSCPVGWTPVVVKVIVGYASTSKKSAERRWSSRCWTSVSMLFVCTVTSARVAATSLGS